MRENIQHHRHQKMLISGIISLALIVGTAYAAFPTSSAPPLATRTAGRTDLALAAVNNPSPAADMCQNLQVLVLVDRSGSVTNLGASTVQQYKDQVKKIWHTLHNISRTYGGYSSGYLWAFGARASDQMPQLITKDNNLDGTINDGDRDLSNPDVLSGFDSMTQNIFFSNDSSVMKSPSQPSSYGYNPDNETHSTLLYQLPGTNWHDAFLMAQKTVSSANTYANIARDYNMVIIITDGAPTLDDGANHKRDAYMKNKSIDENFDGYDSTSSHVSRTKTVVDSLRQGKIAGTSTSSFTPVQVYGILIGGGSAGATRMTNTFGQGNWYQSNNFDSTLGAQLLSIVGATCPPAPTLTAGMQATIVSAPSQVIEDSDVTYIVDVTNTGQALLENVSVANGTVISVPTDTSYTSTGLLSPGKKRRFSITQHIGGAANTATITLPYSAHVADDPSLLVPGTQLNISGTLTASIGIQLVPRPS